MKVGKALAGGTVAALMAAAIYMAAPTVKEFEGTIYHGYIDPAGIVTACTGHTETAELRPYSKEECDELLKEDLNKHTAGAADCIDFEKLTPGQRAAVVSFAFNLGVGFFCKSSFARKLRAGDPTACRELTHAKNAKGEEHGYTYAGGVRYKGLIRRRAAERAMCEKVE